MDRLQFRTARPLGAEETTPFGIVLGCLLVLQHQRFDPALIPHQDEKQGVNDPNRDMIGKSPVECAAWVAPQPQAGGLLVSSLTGQVPEFDGFWEAAWLEKGLGP